MFRQIGRHNTNEDAPPPPALQERKGYALGNKTPDRETMGGTGKAMQVGGLVKMGRREGRSGVAGSFDRCWLLSVCSNFYG